MLVPVPNNQSKISWETEGEKMKNLVIEKMEKDLMPDLKKNIVEDFYLTFSHKMLVDLHYKQHCLH